MYVFLNYNDLEIAEKPTDMTEWNRFTGYLRPQIQNKTEINILPIVFEINGPLERKKHKYGRQLLILSDNY